MAAVLKHLENKVSDAGFLEERFPEGGRSCFEALRRCIDDEARQQHWFLG